MAKRRREKMSEGKKNIIAGLIQEYDIKTAADIQEALKDLLGGTIQEMMEAELDEHLGYEEYERSNNPDYRNGVKHKTLRSSYGEIPIDVPQDRDGDFEPQIVPKRKKDISEIEQKIIAMSAKGMTTRQISDIVEDIYGFEVSESMVTAVTNKIMPRIEEWQQRPLSAVYPIAFIDAIHFSVRDEHIVKKIAAYIILGINDLKSIYHAPNEESGYQRMQDVREKWQERYPNAMKRWEENWDVISPMFKFSADVRKVMYTTNAIESLNSALRRLNSQRSVFPSDTALLKALYLATFEATKKWTMPLRNWGKVYGELSIMYDGRL